MTSQSVHKSSRSIKKFIRREKARIRKRMLKADAERAVAELIARFRRS